MVYHYRVGRDRGIQWTVSQIAFERQSNDPKRSSRLRDCAITTNAIARHIICREEVREVRVMHNLVGLVQDLLHLLHRKLQLLGILHDLASWN